MKCKNCKYYKYIDFYDVCTLTDELVRYDFEACNLFKEND